MASVVPGPVPNNHGFSARRKVVGGRAKPGHDTMVDDHEWLVLLRGTAMTRWSMTTNGSFYLRHGRDAIVDNANGLYYSGAASVMGLSAAG
jgi:hypothetical protein